MIILFIIMVTLTGYTFYRIINKEINKLLGISEIIAVSFSTGAIILTVYIFILNFLGLKIILWEYIPFIISSLIGLGIVVMGLIKSITLVGITKLKNKTIKISVFIHLVLNIAIILSLCYLASIAVSSHPQYPDELAYWANQPAMIYNTGQLNEFTFIRGCSTYPNLFPILNASYYFIFGYDDAGVRLISTLFLAFSIYSCISVAKRRGYNQYIIKLLFVLFIFSYGWISHIASSLYVDIMFMYYHSFSIIYLLEWLYNNNNNNNNNKYYLIISSILMMGAAWTKTDGQQLWIICDILIIFTYIANKYFKYPLNSIIKIRTVIYYTLPTISIIILWFFYCKLKMPVEAVQKFVIRIEYIPSMLKAMSHQLLSYPASILSAIFLAAFIYLFITSKKNLELICFILAIFANIIYLCIAYTLIFQEEALTANSFLRYMTRIYPLIVMITGIILSYPNSNHKSNIVTK